MKFPLAGHSREEKDILGEVKVSHGSINRFGDYQVQMSFSHREGSDDEYIVVYVDITNKNGTLRQRSIPLKGKYFFPYYGRKIESEGTVRGLEVAGRITTYSSEKKHAFLWVKFLPTQRGKKFDFELKFKNTSKHLRKI